MPRLDQETESVAQQTICKHRPIHAQFRCLYMLRMVRKRPLTDLYSELHSFVEIDHEIFSTVILPSADSRRADVSFWRKNVYNTG